MLSDVVPTERAGFRAPRAALDLLRETCARHADLATFSLVGRSEEGRDIAAVVLGRGSLRVSLLAGAHADEPVGPETLRLLVIDGLARRCDLEELFDRVTFAIVPHVNPDGEAANRAWIERWPDALAYLHRAVREPPGRDIEFGYPAMRPENESVAAFLAAHGPFDLHLSLHGMAVADGGWLLIEGGWAERTAEFRRRYAAELEAEGLSLFDWDRGGEKGFHYIEPGFSTTPESAAMRAHFESRGDLETARLFHLSSMEYVRDLGEDPLCLVTELPLFVLRGRVGDAKPGVPETYLRFLDLLPRLRLEVERGGLSPELLEELRRFDPVPLELRKAVRLQLRALELGMETVGVDQGGPSLTAGP